MADFEFSLISVFHVYVALSTIQVPSHGSEFILTTSSKVPCIGETFEVTCRHPVLNASLLAWQRNGTFFSTSASISHEEIETTTKITTLLITLTGEEFASEVYTYRCYTNNQITHQNTFSNSITIDPPDYPMSPTLVEVKPYSKEVQLKWAHSPGACFDHLNYSFQLILWQSTDYAIRNIIHSVQTAENEANITGLIPETAYVISVIAVSVKANVSSLPLKIKSTTLSQTVLLASTPVCMNAKHLLTCYHHDLMATANGVALFNSNTEVIWKEDGQQINLELYSSEFEVTQTATSSSLMILRSVDAERSYQCAVRLTDGYLEESKEEYIENMICSSALEYNSLIAGNGLQLPLIIITVVLTILLYAIYKFTKKQKMKYAANRTDEEHYYPEGKDGDQGDETVSHDSVMVEHQNPSYIALEKLQTFQQHAPLPEYQNVNLAPRHNSD